MITSRLIPLIILVLCCQNAYAAIVGGTVRDASTVEPIGFATVKAVGTSHSASANQDGQYRLKLPAGHYTLKFSHVAHHSEKIEVDVGDEALEEDIYLQPALVEVSPIKVYDRQYDAAQRIIVEAIARKEQILSQIQHYSFQAYIKTSLRDTSKADSNSYLVIVESQVKSFWKYPNKHKEIIVARKQSKNIPAEGNLISTGELLNFNENRIEFGRYSVVSPTATDALNHYDYYLIDTTYLDGKAVFVLEIEPKNQTDPLFEGFIKIADSSYAVVGVDVTVNKGFDSKIVSQLHYRQIFAEFDGRYWMPTMIQFSAVFNLAFPGLPVFSVDYQAALHEYDFASDLEDDLFDEYILEVDEAADDVDSAAWFAGQLMPLTELEQRGYVYVDSVTDNVPLHKKLLLYTLSAPVIAATADDIFHFNRVEGAYLGLGTTFRGIADRLDVRVKSGYAFSGEFWQHEYGAEFLVDQKRKLSLGGQYRNEVRTRPTVFAPPNGNATIVALPAKIDPYDYYLEKGFALNAQIKPLNLTRFNVAYNDFDQSSLAVSTDYSLFDESKVHRANPAIVDGRLRSLQASFKYDSRKLFRSKGRDLKVFSFPFTALEIGTEYAANDLIKNDFNFTRYHAWFYRVQRLFGWGISHLYIYAGASDRTLPPQRYFTLDFDIGLIDRPIVFRTVTSDNYSGSRIFAAYTTHDFERKLFQKSGLPLVKHIPFSLGIRGGVFWSDLKGNGYQPGDEDVRIAPTPYGEIGFSVGRIIPWGFFSTISVGFTWQLSDYDTNKLNIGPTFPMFLF